MRVRRAADGALLDVGAAPARGDRARADRHVPHVGDHVVERGVEILHDVDMHAFCRR